MLFTCIKSRFFRNHSANFHQISHWSFFWNVIDSLFKWSCSIDCQAHIFFFKTKNCSNDDIFISCDDRIGKMLHNICMSAVAMSLRWANRGLWASCFCWEYYHEFCKYCDRQIQAYGRDPDQMPHNAMSDDIMRTFCVWHFACWVKISADDILKYFFLFFLENRI